VAALILPAEMCGAVVKWDWGGDVGERGKLEFGEGDGGQGSGVSWCVVTGGVGGVRGNGLNNQPLTRPISHYNFHLTGVLYPPYIARAISNAIKKRKRSLLYNIAGKSVSKKKKSLR
jgi:hypothetical protein